MRKLIHYWNCIGNLPNVENRAIPAQWTDKMSLSLKKAVCCICIVVALSCVSFPCLAQTCQGTDDSAYWSTLAHEENSVVASVLYIPYLVFQIPLRIVDAIIDPKPTSKATIPPQAHQGPGIVR